MAWAMLAFWLLRGSPWALEYYPQMTTQTHPSGDGKVSEKVKFSSKFQVPRKKNTLKT